MRCSLVLTTLAVLVCTEAPALGVVTTTVSHNSTTDLYTVRVTNEAVQGGGEILRLGQNEIAVTQDSAGNVIVTDTGREGPGGTDIQVAAGGDCFVQTADSVSCPAPTALAKAFIDITTGELSDAVSVTAPFPARIFGGPGGDILFGGSKDDHIEGDGRRGDGSVPSAQDISGPITPFTFSEGADLIAGGGGADLLYGQGSGDYLNGASLGASETDANTLDGGGGRDFLDAGGTLGPDRFTGGTGGDAPTVADSVFLLNQQPLPNGELARVSGGDTVSYGTRSFAAAGTAGVTADLDGVADDGVAGEADQIDADVEALVGSIRDDKLTGNAEANRLEGRLGVDQLISGPGADRMRFNDGVKDKCYSVGTGDQVDADLVDPTLESCQPNFQSFVLTSTALTVSVNFQPVDETIPYVVIGRRLRPVGDNALRAQVRCPRSAARACTGTLAVSHAARERPLARRRFRVRPGRTADVVLRPGADGLAELEKAGRVRLTTVSRGTSRLGPTTTFVLREL